MPPDEPSNLPARQVPLDRATIERVLARAAELQATSGEQRRSGNAHRGAARRDREGSGNQLRRRSRRHSLKSDRGRRSGGVGLRREHHRTRRRDCVATPCAASRRDSRRARSLDAARGMSSGSAPVSRSHHVGAEVGFSRNSSARISTSAGADITSCARSQVAATIIPVDAERVLVRLDADLSESRARA